MQGELKRVVRLFYGFQFFFGMLLWLPIFYDYQRQVGLDDAAIFGIQSIYYIAFCLMEIPTGFLADVWGHRLCMKAGAIVLTVANLLPALAPSYAGFLTHFLLIALARSLISGASSAYLYEYLKRSDAGDLYKRIEGNARSYGLVGKVICWAGVGALMKWQMSLPYWLTAACSLTSVVYAWGFPVLPAVQGALSTSPVSRARSEAWKELGPVLLLLTRSPALILVMLQGIALFVLARIALINLYQPVLAQKSFDLTAYGIVMSVMTLFEAAGSAYPHFLRRWWSDLNSIFVLTLIMALSLFGLSFAGQSATVAWFCLFSLATGLAYPVQRQLLNDAIPDSRYRATFLSIESLIDRAVCAWVASLMGAYVGTGRVNEFLLGSGMVTFASVLVLWGALKMPAWSIRRE